MQKPKSADNTGPKNGRKRVEDLLNKACISRKGKIEKLELTMKTPPINDGEASREDPYSNQVELMSHPNNISKLTGPIVDVAR